MLSLVVTLPGPSVETPNLPERIVVADPAALTPAGGLMLRWSAR
jgi:hypothetical protein